MIGPGTQTIKATDSLARTHQTFINIDPVLGRKEKSNRIPKADISLTTAQLSQK